MHRKVAARGFPVWQFAGVAASLLLVGVLFYPQLTDILEGNPPAQPASTSVGAEAESAELGDSDEPAVPEKAVPEKDDAPAKPSPAKAKQADARLRAGAELSAQSAEETLTKKEAAPTEPSAPQYRQDVADAVDASDDARSGDASDAETDDAELLELPKRSRFAANGPTGTRTLPQPAATERPTPERRKALQGLGYIGGDAELPAGDAAPLPPGVAEQQTVRLIRDSDTWQTLGWSDWPVDFESHAVVVLGTYGQPLACGSITQRIEGDKLILTLPGETGPGAFGCALRVDRQVARVEVVRP